MVGIIIASHGEFALGIKQSASMIFGEQEQVEAVAFMPSEGPEDLQRKLREAMAKFDTEEVLFLVDLWGGSPFNQANILFEESPETRAIVAGLNLPMLMESYASRFTMTKAHDIAKAILPTAQEAVKVKPEELQPVVEQQPVAQKEERLGAIPEGTVLGDGHIKFVLARVDTRLLHGQVATTWTKTTNPDRIIVVSDKVSQDELRKKLIEQAAPPGVKAHVIPLKKLVEVTKDTRFGDTKALLLFENPQDVLAVVEQGVDIKELNIGSMAHSVGKVLISSSLSVDQEDVNTYKKLADLGVKFDVRKVPADKQADLFKLISAKASEGLSL
ncbi:PTS mannose transporter subunit IIAB [Granulicatella sp. zg-ZJ]|uniref:mannose/fructose/sorbose PTS transporter subunit IIB n=1 Tax=unclassified Granulicatella TaxID=2630493 RepID=UPI0013C25A31|nr:MULTISPECIES: mannose/fructose/sorbose PTS transporter subunit IIB [unclassified Granulicatella]MBS4750209.1 mannose/fructose/sorbose PTS transporter subunit IIB [Carnobacteriaceae bacterium zg-ZUI78]NEW63329.1 PTS mannose transporter subunit IIAB [Granulicatella sp. zg-ZJ]NEW66942.1 PTS mannose transporter subunit IIAB [Granulicatella sp. zg-84]QMI85664.1 PTS mannose transporter subunit IIAB [Carnobacteriaceae bacterium zg-84]